MNNKEQHRRWSKSILACCQQYAFFKDSQNTLSNRQLLTIVKENQNHSANYKSIPLSTKNSLRKTTLKSIGFTEISSKKTSGFFSSSKIIPATHQRGQTLKNRESSILNLHNMDGTGISQLLDHPSRQINIQPVNSLKQHQRQQWVSQQVIPIQIACSKTGDGQITAPYNLTFRPCNDSNHTQIGKLESLLENDKEYKNIKGCKVSLKKMKKLDESCVVQVYKANPIY